MRTIAFALSWILVPAALAETPVGPVDQTFESEGVTIRYTIDGPRDGEPVLLIHGYRASGAMNWKINGVEPLLAEKFRVITIDNRGHGKSDKPQRVSEYGAHMADDVVRLMDHLELRDAHLVGYSMGGMITLKLLADHPERVRTAIVSGMGWRPPRPVRDSMEDLPPLEACVRAFPALGIEKAKLERIGKPMTLLIGSKDRLRDSVDALLAVRSDVPLVLIDGADHLSAVLSPEFRKEIRRILDESVGESGSSP